VSFNDYNHQEYFQLPCSSTFDFMARMGVVHAADNSFAGVGGVPYIESTRSKVRTRRVLNAYIIIPPER